MSRLSADEGCFWLAVGKLGLILTSSTGAKKLTGFKCGEKQHLRNVDVGISFSVCQAFQPEVKKARGDVPDILPEPEPEPTSPVSDFETSYNYVCESPDTDKYL